MDENIRTLVRGLDVLRHLNRVGADTGQHIAACLGLSRPTIYRILGTLEKCGLVARNEADATYRVTKGVRGLSEGLTQEAWALWIATPFLYELQEDLLWPTDLTTIEDGQMIIRETTHGVSPYSIESGMVGSRHPLLSSSFGRAYLAFCPEHERHELLAPLRTAGADITARLACDQIERMVRETRACGFGSRQREVHVKTSSIAVPLRHEGRVIACMSVVWIASAMDFSAAVQKCHPALARAQAQIEREFSLRGGDAFPAASVWRASQAA